MPLGMASGTGGLHVIHVPHGVGLRATTLFAICRARHFGGRERTLTLCGSEPAVARLTQPKSVVTVADSLNMAAAVEGSP